MGRGRGHRLGYHPRPRPTLCGDCGREADVDLAQAWPGRWLHHPSAAPAGDYTAPNGLFVLARTAGRGRRMRRMEAPGRADSD